MTREEAKEYLPIIKAYADGKQIQWLDSCGKWIDVDDRGISFINSPSKYRIKSESNYAHSAHKKSDGRKCTDTQILGG